MGWPWKLPIESRRSPRAGFVAMLVGLGVGADWKSTVSPPRVHLLGHRGRVDQGVASRTSQARYRFRSSQVAAARTGGMACLRRR